MNISRLNYLELLPLIKSSISEAHFLSVDLEMSGIQTDPLTSASLTDSVPSILADASTLPQEQTILSPLHAPSTRLDRLQSSPIRTEVFSTIL